MHKNVLKIAAVLQLKCFALTLYSVHCTTYRHTITIYYECTNDCNTISCTLKTYDNYGVQKKTDDDENENDNDVVVAGDDVADDVDQRQQPTRTS